VPEEELDFNVGPRPPESYILQDGCYNCKHVLDQSNEDCEMFHCTLKSTEKPGHPGAPRSYKTYLEYEKASNIWIDWLGTLPSVERNGKCSKWS